MLPGEDRAARRVLMVCLAAGATTLLDQSVLNIAVPALRQSLGAGATEVQWIVAGCSRQPPPGPPLATTGTPAAPSASRSR
ncbi:hypothetical protein ABZ848_16910 [Streptomyces sp. NPDC047081]|uniref:hypothetical protein n=1 Tax=Streptomyces sp. NPDC047081 TaxID=3154706 RepID=UPI0033CDC19E